MRAPAHLGKLTPRPRPPRHTVRLRLTLLYGGLFLISGAALLTITYLLARHFTAHLQVTTNPGSTPFPTGQPLPANAASRAVSANAYSQVHGSFVDQLLTDCLIALAIMAVVSIGLGWLVAGRVLRPLRTMTATTRRISAQNLHERLAISGPRDELTDLGDTIDELLARLETAFEAQRRFVANASHELRTPLAMMRTSLDVAVGKPRPGREVTVLAGKLREGLDQADRLIESFLLLARAQQGAPTDRGTIPLSTIVSDAVAARTEHARRLGVNLHTDLSDIDIDGSQTLLSRMVANVLDNALTHNSPGGFVHVATNLDGPDVQLLIDSSGPPLDQNDVQKLGQPFRRLGAERTASDTGVGLGLSIVAAIATAHGGALRLHARDEGGLRVVIELPRAMRPVPAGAGP
jgi:signal transduction histidine kinase